MPPKNKKKAAPSDAAGGDGGPPAKLNKTDSDFSAIDFGNDCKTESGDKWDFKISSWNVDGMRAWAKKGNYTYLLVSISSHRSERPAREMRWSIALHHSLEVSRRHLRT